MNVEEILRGIYADMPTPALPLVGGDRPMSPLPVPDVAAAPRTAEEVWKEITGAGVAAAAGGVVPPAAAAAAAPAVVVMGFLNGAEVTGGVTGGRSRKRHLMDPMDRAAMQRQKRMIKNRESAARSRERKQAYIAELESLVTQLEEENAKMFKEQEEQHQKRLKELKEMVVPVIIRKTSARDLRRTNSMEW
uniref:BZIP domain-containing protein n=1 Tax=Oryza barthii TaxID=65489 RepID=A0A0D3EWQ1_9ORYZ